MRQTTCRGCGGDKVELFLDLGNMPLAGGFLPDHEAIAREKTFPLPVHVCRECGLVQILEVIDPEILFQEYSFSSSTIGPLVDHFEKYAAWLKDKFEPQLVVEFGCNDGILLAPLERLGIRACGIDVSRNIGDMARAKGLDVITAGLDFGTAELIEARLGKADIVTGSNVFAHNDRPEIILEASRRILKPDGHLCLEFMYAGDLLELWQWDTLYHEHLTFYCVSSLTVLLERYGYHVVDAERIPMHGGALRIVASLNPDEPKKPGVENLLLYEKAKGVNDPATWVDFGKRVARKLEVVEKTLGRLSQNSRVWGYGAAGKATLWVNACNMYYLGAMVDASPLRAGKLMPGTHTPIVFPQDLRSDPPDYIFITAWNYGDLIRCKEDWFQGIWVTPLPDMRFY